jgi:polyhydroxyalkanoate synthesis regulator protein
MNNSLTITKYSNRKLYDKNKKRYTTLSEIKQQIKDGMIIKVVSEKTNKDITDDTLKSIIRLCNLNNNELYNIIRG